MAGKIKLLIDAFIEQRANGNPTIVATTKTKLTLKGVNPNDYTAASPDDEAVIRKVREIAREMGVTL
jgi:hypothetical protein